MRVRLALLTATSSLLLWSEDKPLKPLPLKPPASAEIRYWRALVADNKVKEDAKAMEKELKLAIELLVNSCGEGQIIVDGKEKTFECAPKPKQ